MNSRKNGEGDINDTFSCEFKANIYDYRVLFVLYGTGASSVLDYQKCKTQ